MREKTPPGQSDWQVGRLEVSLLALVALGVLLAWFLPGDLYGRSPMARGFADGIAAVARIMNSFAVISQFPGVTRLVLATLYACVPILAIYIALSPGVLKWRPGAIGAMRPLVRYAIAAVFLVVALIAPIFGSFGAEVLEGHGLSAFCIDLMSTSRLALGVIAGVYCAVAALMLAALPTFLRRN